MLVGKTQITPNGTKSILRNQPFHTVFVDNCMLSGCIMNLEEASVASRICIASTITFLCLVIFDKRIMFKKVLGIEHMLRMKNYSTSDEHFNMTIFIPIVVVGFGIGILNTFFKLSDLQTKKVK